MRQFGMFAKYWRPGEVKTRLARDVGDRAASEFHRECVAVLLKRFADVGQRRVLAYSPHERRDAFAEIAGPAWTLSPQTAGDLGQRMSAYFAATHRAGASTAVLIGTDSPTLPRGFVDQAFAALERVDVVWVPAEDGGYCLIGARGRPPVFEGVDWSTPEVLEQSIHRARAAGCSYELLPSWYDVDQWADARRLAEELASRNTSPEFARLRELVAVLSRRSARPQL